MPTGYTAGIENGTITTFKEYALLCARAFGPTIHQRDDALSVPLTHRKNDSYYKKSLRQAMKDKKNWEKLTIADKKEEYQKVKKEFYQFHMKILLDAKQKIKLYTKMKKEVVAWVPPTEDHKGLKKFMLQQIDDSMRLFDVNQKFSFPSFTCWLNERSESLDEDIEYYTKRVEKDVQITNESNLWIDALVKSLE